MSYSQRDRRFARNGAAGIFLTLTCAAALARTPVLEVGSTPPDFALPNLVNRERVRLSAESGKPVILTFWASWCGPCRKELPILEAIQKQIGTGSLRVIAVSWHENDEAIRALRKVVKSWSMTLVEDAYGALGQRYGVVAIPRMYIIGRDGRIAAIRSGYADTSFDDLIAEVNAVLRPERPGQPSSTSTPPAPPQY